MKTVKMQRYTWSPVTMDRKDVAGGIIKSWDFVSFSNNWTTVGCLRGEKRAASYLFIFPNAILAC